MSLTDGSGLSAADISAVLGGNNGRNVGWGADGAWWIIILFLFAFNGNGWGNGFGGNGNGFVQADVQRGFDQQATQTSLSALQSQIGNGFAQQAVSECSGNAAITAAINNAQFGTINAINNSKDVVAGGMNALAMSLQQCCCENRSNIADLKYTVATENCADRQAISDGLRDLMAQNTANTNAIIQSNTQGFQGIQDKLCQLEIDGLKSANEQLRTQLNMANLAASQTAQTAAIIQDNNAQTAALINRIAPAPIPAYTVANPNGCVNFGGCGCM